MTTASPLQPVDPATFHLSEQEKEKPWIVRKIVQSVTGRIVMAVGQTLQATGTTVICLSPWGMLLPHLRVGSEDLILGQVAPNHDHFYESLIYDNPRFRDIIIHTVVAATGGAAIVATPLMDSAGGVVVDSFGSSIIVELGTLEASGKVANYLLIDKPANLLIPTYSSKLETTNIKKILITLQFKHILTDASLGYYRAPAPGGIEPSLFSSVKEYLSIDKGWFNPYLFASCRRPLIPRTMIPDVVFCHGPWLKGDYSIGSTLLKESTTVIALTPDPELPPEEEDPSLIAKALAALKFGSAKPAEPGLTPEAAARHEDRPPSPTGLSDRFSKMFGHRREKSKDISSNEKTTPSGPGTPTGSGPPLHKPPSHPPPGHSPSAISPSLVATAVEPASSPADSVPPGEPTTMIDRLTDQINQWRGIPSQTAIGVSSGSVLTIPTPPPNRRMVVLVLAISPHRAGVWTSSARPGESVMNYTLLNGCHALVVPIKPGCPLIAWHAVTLKTLQSIKGGVDGDGFKEILDDLVNYMDLCVDEGRVELAHDYAEQSGLAGTEVENKRNAVRAGMSLVLAGAMRSGTSSKVKKEVDCERAGIVFFRIP